jgi:hypothetical protein
MAQTPALPADPEGTRFVEPVVRPVVKATDLGSVVVLKQGNQYLLTDPFGDIRPDTRGWASTTRTPAASRARSSGSTASGRCSSSRQVAGTGAARSR